MKRPILYIVIPFCIGIALARFIRAPIVCTVAASAVFLALALLNSRRNIPSHILLYLAVFFFGMSAYQNSVELPANHIAHFVQNTPQKVFVRGVVADDPVTGPALYGKTKTSFTLKAFSIRETLRDKGVEGSIRDDEYFEKGIKGLIRVNVYFDKGTRVSFGDELTLEGMLSKPHGLKNPGVFDYEEYLAAKGIYAVLKVKEDSLIKERGAVCFLWPQESAYNLRRAIRNRFDRYLKPPYNGFMKAILIGDKTGLDGKLKDDFVKTGTVHILAISGLHVGLMSGIILALFALLRMPKNVNLVLSALVLIFYSFAAGSSPPIIRAVIIFCVFVVGRLVNRDADLLNSLAFAALLMLLWKPGELFDPSFQLSFASVAGIIIFTSRIDAGLKVDSIRRKSAAGRLHLYVLKGVSVSIAAWLGTWPFVAAYFNIVSPAAILANLIVIPMLFLLMALSLIFLSAGAISSLFAKPAAYILCMTGKLLFWSNHGLASLPFSYFRIGSPSAAFVILYYAFIFVLFFPRAFQLGRRKIDKAKIIAILLIFFNVLVWKDISAGPNRKGLKVTFLDVGHGDSIFMELPGSGTVLIDGGSGGEPDAFDAGRSVVAPYLWNKRVSNIDAVIVTHFHEDHLGGVLYILNNFRVGVVIDNGAAPHENKIYREYLDTIRRKGVRRIAVGEGDEIGPFGGYRFFVLNPKTRESVPAPQTKRNENDDSIVLKIIYKNFSMLFCADITDEPMKRLTETYGKFLKSDVIKVPHHGGGFKDEHVVENFFKLVSPNISVISVGKTDRDEASSPRVSKIITRLNLNSYDTKTYGAISVYSDGNSFGVRFPFLKKTDFFILYLDKLKNL